MRIGKLLSWSTPVPRILLTSSNYYQALETKLFCSPFTSLVCSPDPDNFPKNNLCILSENSKVVKKYKFSTSESQYQKRLRPNVGIFYLNLTEKS